MKENKGHTRGDQDRARSEIDARVAQVHQLLEEARKIADENGVTFSLQVAYGMGGTYFPPTPDGIGGYEAGEGWVASSEMC